MVRPIIWRLETLDRRADIWALAAICFECLTGTVPFGPGEGPQILLKILTSEPSPLNESLCPGFPEQPLSLDLVLGQAFKKIPSLRQETVGQFADALGQALGLVGSHNNWASLSERELTQSILQQLPRLMNEQAREQGHSIQDDFFGDEDSLGELNRASTEHPNTDKISMTSNLSLLSAKATGRVIQGGELSSPATLKNELPVENLFRNKWVIVSFLTLLMFLNFFFN